MTETRASTTDRRAVRRTTAEAPRGARCNHQQILPLVQALALPIYWLIGRQLGLGPIAATAFMLVAPFAMHSAVLACGFVVSWFNQAGRPSPRHGRRRDWLLAFVVEAGMSIRQFYWLMPFRAGFREPPPVPPAQPLAVILVHGYGCNRGLWLPAARWFAMHGYRVSAINLAPMHCRIDDYAPQIAAEIARVRAAAGAPRVALVAHSMGGLAARAYLRDCQARGEDSALAALVTLGTPHVGTHIARIGLGENARQMRYGAPWLAELGPRQGVPGPMIATIGSFQDNIVSRPIEQRLALERARGILVRGQGHMTLATSTRVFRVVDRILRRAAAGTGAAGPCRTGPPVGRAPDQPLEPLV